MKAILVRIGVDQTYGHWNAPVDSESCQFVYVPIPERSGTLFQPGLERRYAEVLPTLRCFSTHYGLELERDLGFPRRLLSHAMHLDPDFELLTYGDNGDKRGAEIKNLTEGDLLVFYAGLQSVRPSQELVYALVGLYVVDDVVLARDVSPERWRENAHTRKLKIGLPDIVVRAKPGISGRLARCIAIGEWRDRAYRVRRNLMKSWGGLSVNDGFIQRSAQPPRFLDPGKFYRWFLKQNVSFVANNNPMTEEKVILVHLRVPRSKADLRDDPFWEYGSFGITGCHFGNLMSPNRSQELVGARLAFVQGGRNGLRLVFVSPPVERVVKYKKCSEAIWSPKMKPFKYDRALLLLDAKGRTDGFKHLKKYVQRGKPKSWKQKLSFKFRSRIKPLESEIADEIITRYQNCLSEADASAFTDKYYEALPFHSIEHEKVEREIRYEELQDEAGRMRTPLSCSPRSKRRRRTKC